MRLQPVDWPKILVELRHAGFSLPAISRALHLGDGTPYRWLNGSQPLHHHGEALLKLHRINCSESAGVHSGVHDDRRDVALPLNQSLGA